MGWVTNAAPGTQAGPCAEPCAHIDCAENRKLAESPCPLCGKPLGYEEKIYLDPPRHFACALAQRGRP